MLQTILGPVSRSAQLLRPAFLALGLLVAIGCQASKESASTCPNGETSCESDGGSSVCLGHDADLSTCGVCGRVCPAGTTCTGNGQCVPSCSTGETLCGELCTNTQTDPGHCGGCADQGGRVCPGGQTCSAGTCSEMCGPDEAVCHTSEGASYCSDPSSDPKNCGGCGNVCDPGATCAGGVCTCPSRQVDCNGSSITCASGHCGGGAACSEQASDPDNCGACGVVCSGSKKYCTDGSCVDSCTGTGLEVCGPLCVNTLTDNANCGGCGNVCDPGATCTNGVCTCPGGQADCNGVSFCASGHCGDRAACTNPANDPSNCGACGTVCSGPAKYCTTGSCAASCAGTGEEVCGRLCVNTLTDNANCGGCGIVCDPGATCTNGMCTCPTKQIDCSGSTICTSGHCGGGATCANRSNDPSNCGACGTVCSGSAKYCTDGSCAASCSGTGTQVCGVLCVNTSTDNANCGGCGNVCDPGATCIRGVCTCPNNQVDCHGSSTCASSHCGGGAACTNQANDPSNCGACGPVCSGTAKYCADGSCAASCSGTGALVCGALCVNALTDNANCGGCGNVCDPGATCTNGVCTCPSSHVDCKGVSICANGHCGGGAVCTSQANDPSNCGECGVVCSGWAKYCTAGSCAASCDGTGLRVCDGLCANTLTDNANCGGCGNVCDPGASCTNGVCTCPSNEVDCDGSTTCESGHCGGGAACTNKANDPNNCGACGTVCSGPSKYCTDGSCQASCTGTGLAVCDGLCANTLTDNANCGGCGNVCDPGASCTNGVCTCPSNQVDCNGSSTCASGHCGGGAACTNKANDPSNCGACGTVCSGSTKYCTDGSCQASCVGTGLAVCDDLCANTLTDNANCGGCGTVCDPGATCTEGVCTCPSNQVDCDGSATCESGHCGHGAACTNEANDPDNCGTCGTVCSGSTKYCTDGSCQASCTGTGLAVCNGLCANTLTDNANCGGCGNVCDPGATCTNGVCTCPSHQVDCDGSSTCESGHCGGGAACTNKANDPNNCGACGTVCSGSTKYCTDGSCQASCTGTGLAVCNGLCANTLTDNANCGGCGNVCDPGATCTDGVCACPNNQADCDGSTACDSGHCGHGAACTNKANDPNNCGACGTVCSGSTKYCTEGTCAASCSDTGGQLCGSLCVNPLTDNANCGDCGQVCDPGATCTNGVCTCPAGQVDCNGSSITCTSGHCGDGAACANKSNDPSNCGECGNVCSGSAKYCTGGSCQASCAGEGAQLCGSVCVNALTDNANCGDCGNVCDPGATCKNGVCTCPSGQVDCDGSFACPSGNCGGSSACTDQTHDPNHCGDCWTVCAGSKKYCTDGSCQASCVGTGLAVCNALCANTLTDNANCGGCGNVCDPGATCTDGVCTCPSNQVDCDGSTTCSSGHCGGGAACTNQANDPNNCGACGTVCSGNRPYCSTGVCQAVCAGTQEALCGENCINTATDGSNCGGCGIVCDPGTSCVAGVCRCPTGQTDCNGGATCTTGHCGGSATCTDQASDSNHCGDCSTVCSAPQGAIGVCRGGACGIYAITLAITFNAKGGTGSMNQQLLAMGSSANLTANAFTKTGYGFAGWATTSGGTVAYADHASYTMGAANVTLYAVWTPNNNTITFNANGGTGSMSDQTIATDASANLTTNAFVRTGYLFDGWATSSGGAVAYADQAAYTMGTSSVTLYAVWRLNQYTITFNANGGTGTMGNQTLVTGASANLSANAFTRTGYLFTGWAATSGGSLAYADQASYTMGASDLTLYAVWARIYTISFDANGGTGSMSNQTIASGATAHLTTNTFSFGSLTFAGWATTSTGGVAYDDGQPYTMGASDVTLYAVWAFAAPVAHYNFTNQNCTDLSGQGKDCTPTNVSYVSDGSGGYAATFNGVGSYAAMPQNTVDDVLTNALHGFTIMIRFRATSGQYGALLGYQDSQVGGAPSHYVSALAIRSDGKLAAYLPVLTASSFQVVSSSVVNDGAWHVVYFSASPYVINLYLDGTSIGSTTQSIDAAAVLAYNQLGAGDSSGYPYQPNANGGSNSWYYYNGLIGEFFLYGVPIPSCGTGTYGLQASSCSNCAAGQYQPYVGATLVTQCLNCAAGYSQNQTGSVACNACPTGYWQNLTGQTACNACGTGTFQNQTGQTSSSACTNCLAGTVQNQTGQAGCTNCTAGYYQNLTGQTSCLMCGTGTYSLAGATTCTKCATGTFSNQTAATSSATCAQCHPGYYQNLTGQAACTACPAETYNPSAGSSAATACLICQYEFFSYAGSAQCTNCSFNTDPSQYTQCQQGGDNQ